MAAVAGKTPYLGVLKMLLLGGALWLSGIAFAGLLIARLWGTAVIRIVFENGDGIGVGSLSFP